MSKHAKSSTEREPRTDVERKVAAQLDAAVLRGDGVEALRLRQALAFLQAGPPITTAAEAKKRKPVYLAFTGEGGFVRDEHGKLLTSTSVAGMVTKVRTALSRLFGGGD